MSKSVGIIINSFFNHQLPEKLFSSLNKLADSNPEIDPIVFRQNTSIFPSFPRFAIMNLRECWGFKAPVISTDMSTTEYLLSFPGPTKKLFYVWNLEWIFQSNLQIETVEKIYLADDINLIARNQIHYNILKNNFKEPIGILEDFNHEQLLQFI